MKEFSALNAWRLGLRFVSGQPLPFAIILIGIGVVTPAVLQYLVTGMAIAAGAGAAAQSGAMSPGYAGGAIAIAALATGSVLQLGSVFAAWHFGFRQGARLVGAIGFGLLAGLLVALGLAAVGAIAVLFGQIMPAFALIAAIVAGLLLMAVVGTTVAAMFAVGLSLAVVLLMLLGVATGDLGLAATWAGGGSGFVVVLLLVVSGVFLWLAARLSCAMPSMAAQGGFNLVAAVGDSWQRTWEDEWRITRYLALVGLLLAVTMIVVVFATATGLVTVFGPQGAAESQLFMAFVQIVIGIPLAYLGVLVPAGIYQELSGEQIAAEVFA